MTKRLMDIVLSMLGLVVLSPLLVIVAMLIMMESPGGAFFRQVRVGREFKLFKIYKFRTMHVGLSGSSITIAHDPRITSLGAWLRRTKIDELPQLLNVIRGEMSLVGPRPELPKYTALFPEEYERILRVRPGITDPAAVAFRREESMLWRADDWETEYCNQILPHKLELSERYMAEATVFGDFRLILKSLSSVCRP